MHTSTVHHTTILAAMVMLPVPTTTVGHCHQCAHSSRKVLPHYPPPQRIGSAVQIEISVVERPAEPGSTQGSHAAALGVSWLRPRAPVRTRIVIFIYQDTPLQFLYTRTRAHVHAGEDSDCNLYIPGHAPTAASRARRRPSRALSIRTPMDKAVDVLWP